MHFILFSKEYKGAISISDYIMQNNRMRRRINWKNIEGSGRGIIYDNILTFAWTE
jgi:hypothetical protein